MSQRGSLSNWAGNVAFGATRIYEPESLDALRHPWIAAVEYVPLDAATRSAGLLIPPMT